MGSFRYNKIQLDIEVLRTQTTEMNKHDYSIALDWFFFTSFSSRMLIYIERLLLLHCEFDVRVVGVCQVIKRSTAHEVVLEPLPFCFLLAARWILETEQEHLLRGSCSFKHTGFDKML